MLIQIITNLDNGAGLQQDYALLSHVLTEAGHTVRGVHIHRPQETLGKADLNIYLEVFVPSVSGSAPKNWMVPNSEWWGHHWNAYLRVFDRVLCKTPDCLRIWSSKVAPEKCVLIGWAAKDLWNSTIPKQPKFLHTAGKSQTKNTAAVMEAWRRYKIPHLLTVSAFKPEIARLCRNVPNVRLVNRFSPEDLLTELNSSRFFLMPSKYEGYGHAIHEALGAKAVVLTTDGEPMKSFSGVCRELLIPVERRDKMSEAVASIASVRGIADTVKKAVAMPSELLDTFGDLGRVGFLRDNEFFHETIKGQINAI